MDIKITKIPSDWQNEQKNNPPQMIMFNLGKDERS